MRKGNARLNISQIATGFVSEVVGKLEDTEMKMEARTIMQVMLMV